jgi:hypothetical protein
MMRMRIPFSEEAASLRTQHGDQHRGLEVKVRHGPDARLKLVAKILQT